MLLPDISSIDFQFVSSLAVMSIIFLLGVFVFLSQPKHRINKVFLLMTIFIDLWIISVVMRFYSLTDGDITTYAQLSFGFATLLVLSVFLFSLFFPDTNRKLTKREWLLVSTGLVVSVISFSPYTVESIRLVDGAQVDSYNFGYFVFILYFITYVSLIFLNLFKKYKYLSPVGKAQIQYILTGFILSLLFGFTTNIVLPFFTDIANTARVGPISAILFVAMTSLAILKYQLFNLKVVATELFVFALWIAVLIRTLISQSLNEIWFNGALLILLVVVGTLLIRSVIREVRQREELAVANKGQENLIHIMNHQIKGYLGKNKGIFAELLSGDHGSFNGTAKKYIEEGLRQSTEGVEYVQTILKGASASKGKLEYDMKPVDVSELVHEVAEDQKSSAEKNDLHFEVDIADKDFNTTGDASQLKEAFRNLIENAINYSDAGGDVLVSLHKEGGNIVFEVKDTGKGIPEELKPRLFTPGGRSKDATDYNPNTSGFGLAFVKGVVEAHHGRVDYKPNPDGKGTVFFIELPVK